jgi:mRNA-degrading endonuclease YafQ of YafQ-DinJ toxin-antitoxin module
MKTIIDYSPEFARRFKKLPREIRLKVIEKESIFRNDFRDPRLKTHKLSGSLKGRLAFWVDLKTRIIFSILDTNHFLFLSVGNHDIYK